MLKFLSSYTLLLILCISIAQGKTLNNLKENTDITDTVNQEIKAMAVKGGGAIQLPAGNFYVDAVKSINLLNNITIILDKNTTLNVIPTAAKFYQVFNINKVRNVSIENGTLIGDKYRHLGKTGEWGMGINIKDAQNVTVKNMAINKMWGDAIYLGMDSGTSPNNNVFLTNITMDDNRRQGLSVISVKNLYVKKLRVSNTKGTPPADGIDIEPNNNKGYLENLNFTDIITSNNQGNGFQVSLSRFKNTSKKVSIKLTNHVDNGSYFGLILNGVSTRIDGDIIVNDTNYSNSRHSNYCFHNWQNNNIKVNLNNIKQDKANRFKISRFCIDYTANPQIRLQNVKSVSSAFINPNQPIK